MAFITVPSINIGDEIKVDTLNSFIDSVNAVPTNINAENIRDEGIDRRNLATDSVQVMSQKSIYYYASDEEHVIKGSGTSWVTVTQEDTSGGGSGHPVMVGRPTTITCEDDEWVMVNCSFSFRAGSKAVTGITAPLAITQNKGGPEVRFRLIWDDVAQGVSLSYVSGTERRFNSFLGMDGGGIRRHASARYSCTIVGAIKPSLYNSGNHTIAVGLQAIDRLSNDQSNQSSAVIESVSMIARVIKR